MSGEEWPTPYTEEWYAATIGRDVRIAFGADEPVEDEPEPPKFVKIADGVSAVLLDASAIGRILKKGS